LTQPDSLRFAAETTAQFGFFAEAVSYREKLAALSPDETANRIELAKLFAKVKSPTDAAKILLEIISDKNSNRSARWQSIVALAEIIGADENLWQTIINENQALADEDSEMWNALKAFSLDRTNRPDEAVKLLQDSSFTPQLKFLKAVFEKNSGQDESALKSFSELLKTSNELQKTFGVWEDSPLFQSVNLYLKTGKTLAAIDLAKTFQITKSADSTDKRQLGLFDDLSKAAEEIGDFVQAVEFEKAKSELLENSAEKDVSLNRIQSLQQKIVEITNSEKSFPVINEKFVSDF
jgi:hypothetical protein